MTRFVSGFSLENYGKCISVWKYGPDFVLIFSVRAKMSLADKLKQVERLEAELDALLGDSSVAELKTENAKLNYQINQLKKAIAEERSQIKPPTGQFLRVFWTNEI